MYSHVIGVTDMNMNKMMVSGGDRHTNSQIHCSAKCHGVKKQVVGNKIIGVSKG